MSTDRRDLYAREALPLVRSMLQLLDRDPLSPTYGCFDRSYWHFRTMDFPSGMSQEFALPVALAWKHPFPGNRFQGEPRLREWVRAAVDFARRSAHPDGSCDDYYPFERALGAAAFSLYGMAEACLLAGIDDGPLVAFLAKRARWCASHGESGVLANHHAIAAAALDAVFRLTGDDAFARAARAKAEDALRHQHAEGWFQEYEGFDPGYQTVTVDFLARYGRASGDERVQEPLEKAVLLLERVQHPDGTLGGEHGSRNTYHFQPHGLEILGPRVPAALRVADRFLDALAAGRRAFNDDDRLQGHHVYPYLLAWCDFAPRPPEAPAAPPPERAFLPGCGFLVDRRADAFLVAGLRKGAPFRAYAARDLVANDSGIALRLRSGEILVSHLAHDAAVGDDGRTATARGVFHRARRERMTPMKAIVLRLLMLTIGRGARDLVRRRLQRRLIVGRRPSPFRFERTIASTGAGWTVTDRITREPGAPEVLGIHLGVGQTSIYVAASQPWQDGWLLPWTDLSHLAPALNGAGTVEHRREIAAAGVRTPGIRT